MGEIAIPTGGAENARSGQRKPVDIPSSRNPEFKFYNPDNLFGDSRKRAARRSTTDDTKRNGALDPAEVRERARDHVVAIIAPPWVPIPASERTYGSTKAVIEAEVNNLQDLVRGQILYGHPRNRFLRTRDLITISPKIPGVNIPSDDLFTYMQEHPDEGADIEERYVRAAYADLAQGTKNIKVDIIHDHTAQGVKVASEIENNGTHPELTEIPIVNTVHGPVKDGPTYTELIESARTTKDFHLAAISESQRLGDPNLPWLSVNWNGIDLAQFRYKNKTGQPPDREDYLLFLGRINSDKGPDMAIKIAKALGIRLILAGPLERTPDSLKYYETYIKSEIDNRHIIHLNGVGRDERKDLLAGARAVLAPNRWKEPFGMMFPEAQASGTPVVTFAQGAAPEVNVSGETGYVEPRQPDRPGREPPDDMIEITKDFINGKGFSSEFARRRAERLYSSPIMTGRYVMTFAEALRRSRRQGRDEGLLRHEVVVVNGDQLRLNSQIDTFNYSK